MSMLRLWVDHKLHQGARLWQKRVGLVGSTGNSVNKLQAQKIHPGNWSQVKYF